MSAQISVVVPVFNGERDLAGCLASIGRAVAAVPSPGRAQLEVVICDNHSTDRSREIAAQAELGCETRIVQPRQHEENRTRNWAFGLAAANGAWLQMLHADDELSPQALVAQLALAGSGASRTASLLSGRHRTFAHTGDAGTLHVRWPLASLLDGERLARGVLPLQCTLVPFTLMRREAYERAGGLDERWQLVQDWELWMRLAQTGDVLVHTAEIGRWRLHATSPGYRVQNASEHVELAGRVDAIVPSVGRHVAQRARAAAAARAALNVAGLDEPAPTSLGALPGEAEARRTLRTIGIEVTARLGALRAAGSARHALRR